MSRPDRVRASDPDADAPEWWRRSAKLSRISIVAVVVIVAVILAATRSSSPPPPITKSCTTPAFVLSTYSTQSHKSVQWSATGFPAGGKFTLAIGVERFDISASGRLTPVPDPGVGTHDIRATPVQTMDGDCVASGRFTVALPKRAYTVRLFRIVGAPGAATATSVAERTLTVTTD